jgi:hypothetical protein
LIATDEGLFLARVIGKISGEEKVPYLFASSGREDSSVPCGQYGTVLRDCGRGSLGVRTCLLNWRLVIMDSMVRLIWRLGG